jgi:acetyl-CoA C-acetyltransferase
VKADTPIFLCSAKRTAIGSFNGALASVSGIELGNTVVRAVIADSAVPPESIDEVILGCVLMSGMGQAPARQVALGSGLPNSVQAMTINKVCSSGLKAVMLAVNEVRLGNARAIIAGGMESMSNAPYLLPAMRRGARLGNTSAEDSILKDALWDVYNDFHMGNCAELCAREFNLSREAQDAFAIESYRRANKAVNDGAFSEEIVAVEVTAKKTSTLFEIDEEPARGNPAKIPELKAVFDKDGTVTAANASSINDGSAAMLVCSEDYAKEYGLTPLARVISSAAHAQEPERFTTAPVGAVSKSLSQAGLSVSEIDLFEINEAFAAVALACGSLLKVDSEKLNINGGAVALGHPVGASGARILTTLLYALKSRGLKRGAVGICNGGGEATSMIVERV